MNPCSYEIITESDNVGPTDPAKSPRVTNQAHERRKIKISRCDDVLTFGGKFMGEICQEGRVIADGGIGECGGIGDCGGDYATVGINNCGDDRAAEHQRPARAAGTHAQSPSALGLSGNTDGGTTHDCDHDHDRDHDHDQNHRRRQG